MQLDRQSIVRSDFPLERRGGYSPTAVDAHLEAIATAVAQLQAAQAGQTAAGAVSGQVASIVSAAEQAAQRIEAEAVERAREHDARVAAAANELLERIDALRAGVEQLPGQLAAVRREAAAALASNGTVSGAAAHPEVAEPKAPPRVEAVEEVAAEPVAAVPDPVPVAEPPAAAKPATAPRSTAVEDARLVALEMLLEGRSRDEVDSFLAANYDLPDRGALLDEVVTAAGV